MDAPEKIDRQSSKRSLVCRGGWDTRGSKRVPDVRAVESELVAIVFTFAMSTSDFEERIGW
jgi:hypothetical protein